ncbi:hypothetical protein HY522_01430 [bacterium]|nr:hypothetical protein [bacterium]
MSARKKVFIIHGKGVQNNLGKESGGDLDTVASNVFYSVWAYHHLSQELGRKPVYGQDYVFDFVNYSEGLFHLVVHPGSDIYLPDFPIDALAPRVKMLVISEKAVIGHLNEFTRLFTELRRWIVDYAKIVSREIVSISNEIFLQYAKVVEHQESEAIRAGSLVVCLYYNLAYLNIIEKTKAGPEAASKLKKLIRPTVMLTVGDEFKQLKKTLCDAIDPKHKQELIDRVMAKNYEPAVERDYILALKQASDDDLTTKGRMDHTDELMILVVETIAYIVRGARLARLLPMNKFDVKLAAKITESLEYASKTLQRYFARLLTHAEGIGAVGDEGGDISVNNLRICLKSLAQIAGEIQNPSQEESYEGLVPIRLMMIYEASGIAVSNIEVFVRRLEGAGVFVLPDGTELPGPEISRMTDRDGAVELYYRPASSDEAYRISATFDGMIHIYFPSDTNPNVDSTGPYIEEGMDFSDATGIDRAMKVSLDLMERQIKFLKDHDIGIAAIDDHHPYTPAIFGKLRELEEQGYIGHIKLSSLARGQEQAVEEQKCGADLIYEQYIEGRPWDNVGLRKLRDLAHDQDLAIARHDLAMQLSKLIGLKHRKIEMVMTLSQNIKDIQSLDEIMARTEWDKEVRSFDGHISRVIPRCEEIIGHIVLARNGEDAAPVYILAVMPPFCDPKKGEPQVNLATAMGYLLGGKQYPADYFFYCYNSDMLQMRRSNKQDDSLDLSTLAQRLGTPGDGGHSGSATCRPGLNPAFPARLFSKINELNFLQYLGYVGSRISEATGLRLMDVMPPAGLELSEEQKECIEKIAANSHILGLVHRDSDANRINVLVVRAPVKSMRVPIGYLQIFHYVRTQMDAQYLIYCQQGLGSMVIQNVKDPARRLNPGRLARDFGWPEDGGTDLVGIASGRLNKYIKPDFRWLRDDDFFRLCTLFGLILDNRTEYKVKSYSKPK